ncbi:MAG: PAS domain-containing protein [Betaproteobacteria bacterium]|nr:PAS domain-containing protein [Betaproteobacteria bacterium]
MRPDPAALARQQSPLPSLPWTAEHDKKLAESQVDELYRFIPFTTLVPFLGAGLTLGVLMETGAGRAALIWFLLFTAATAYRGLLWFMRGRVHDIEPATWGQLVIIGNLAAGCLWGALGSVFISTGDSYREIFIIMVICCFVGGSVTSYAPLKWAHAALALPAVIPPLLYLGLVRDNFHSYGVLMGIVFVAAITGVALQQHSRIKDRLRLIIQNEELLARLGAANAELLRENSNLAHRAAVRLSSARKAQGRADMLSRHFENTPLAMLECDRRLRLLAWNDAAEKLLGRALQSLLGEPLLPAIFPGDQRSDSAESLLAAASGEVPASITTRFHDLSRNPVDATFHITPIEVEKGLPGRVAVVIARERGNGHLKHAA